MGTGRSMQWSCSYLPQDPPKFDTVNARTYNKVYTLFICSHTTLKWTIDGLWNPAWGYHQQLKVMVPNADSENTGFSEGARHSESILIFTQKKTSSPDSS